MHGTKLIQYEQTHYKLNWKYKSALPKADFVLPLFSPDTPRTDDGFEIISVSEIEREINYCHNSTQYIMGFIEMLKHRVIRFLPNLNQVNIRIGIYDENNILHRVIVGAYCVICSILKKEAKPKSIYKTIFTIIEYEGRIVFMGDLSFNGIDE